MKWLLLPVKRFGNKNPGSFWTDTSDDDVWYRGFLNDACLDIRVATRSAAPPGLSGPGVPFFLFDCIYLT